MMLGEKTYLLTGGAGVVLLYVSLGLHAVSAGSIDYQTFIYAGAAVVAAVALVVLVLGAAAATQGGEPADA